MTIKQCESCKYHTYKKVRKEYHESCFWLSQCFMKPQNCDIYKQGKLNQGRKEFFREMGMVDEND